jgi:Bacterial Ig-like domain/Bacterial pre-peptidase C-terminal domain
MRRLQAPIFGALLALLLLPATALALADVAPSLGGNEPHSAVVNPLNPHNVIVSEGNALRISTDFGRTFPILVNPAAFPATYSGCGDDVLSFDSQGRLFWAYLICIRPQLNEVSVIVQQVNPTTGALIGGAIDVTPGTFSDDKVWIAADANAASPFRDNLYVVFYRFSGVNRVMFSRSTNNGATWSAPTAVNGADPFAWPPHVAVAPNGDVYVANPTDTCGSATATVDVRRDSTGGADLAAGNAVQTSSFQAAVTCNVQASPEAANSVPNTAFWMQGAAQPYVIPDPVRPGDIYVVVNDDPNDNFTTGDYGDVILARSTNNGNSWSISTVDHGPANTLQVYPTGAIDQDGNLAVFWYDTRGGATNAGGNLLLDAYASVSRDGGQTFTNDFRINDVAFDPDLGAPCRFGPVNSGCGTASNAYTANTLRIGEYNGIAAANGVAYAAWTGNTATGQQVVFDVFSMNGAFADRFEPNESIQAGVPTDLGAHSTYSEENLTIHRDLDEDFFKVTALATGSLRFDLVQNPRLPDLDIQVRDKFNNLLATASGGATDSNATEAITIPVVQGQPYYLRVYASPGTLVPNQFPAINVYSLDIANTAAPIPFSLDLSPASDSGWFDDDDRTNVTTPTITLRVDQSDLAGLALSPTNDSVLPDDAPGYKVALYLDGSFIGTATQTSGNGVYSFTVPASTPLTEGVNFLTSKVLIVDASDDPGIGGTSHQVGGGGESIALIVTLDTLAPATPAAPDLRASSDTAGVNDDNITTVQAPHFVGTGEANARLLLHADGTTVGSGAVNAAGAYDIASNALGDGVYLVDVQLEDRAGNLSLPSATLKVTIAHDSLTLPGGTTVPASGAVAIDLAAGTVSGYVVPSLSGNVGIVGIPTVNLAVNGQVLSIAGTAGDDALTYTPTGPAAGNVSRAGSSQVIHFSQATSSFTVDLLGGQDDLTVVGTSSGDAIVAAITTLSTVQVNALRSIDLAMANLERLTIMSGQGQDAINVTGYDTLNALLFVDGGDPSASNKNADGLTLTAGSPDAKLSNAPGGPVQGSGVGRISYPKTTGTTVRVDYAHIEKVTLKK